MRIKGAEIREKGSGRSAGCEANLNDRSDSEAVELCAWQRPRQSCAARFSHGKGCEARENFSCRSLIVSEAVVRDALQSKRWAVKGEKQYQKSELKTSKRKAPAQKEGSS